MCWLWRGGRKPMGVGKEEDTAFLPSPHLPLGSGSRADPPTPSPGFHCAVRTSPRHQVHVREAPQTQAAVVFGEGCFRALA